MRNFNFFFKKNSENQQEEDEEFNLDDIEEFGSESDDLDEFPLPPSDFA